MTSNNNAIDRIQVAVAYLDAQRDFGRRTWTFWDPDGYRLYRVHQRELVALGAALLATDDHLAAYENWLLDAEKERL